MYVSVLHLTVFVLIENAGEVYYHSSLELEITFLNHFVVALDRSPRSTWPWAQQTC